MDTAVGDISAVILQIDSSATRPRWAVIARESRKHRHEKEATRVGNTVVAPPEFALFVSSVLRALRLQHDHPHPRPNGRCWRPVIEMLC